MERNNRRKYDLSTKNIKLYYLVAGIVAVIAIALIIFLTFSGNNKSTVQDSQKYGATQSDTQLEEANSKIGKTVEESKDELNENTTNNTEKIAVNTSNINNTTEKENKAKQEKKNVANNTKSKNEENETKEEVTFIKPVGGDIVKEFAKDNLVYSETLNEWITHNGIDLKAEKAEVVKASADGIVKTIKNDPRYGLTVTIEHKDGYKTVYSNLLTSEFVVEGEKIQQGQTIGTVGNTASFESSEESHLHFEILKENENIDPTTLLK